MELIGSVLWWSDKDENGIIIDPNGNEFYFDRSVLKIKSSQTIYRKSIVTFNVNQSISDCLCACNVQMKAKVSKKSSSTSIKKNQSTSVEV